MKIDSTTYKIVESGKLGKTSLIIGIIFLLISLAGYFQDSAHFYLNYLTSFFFWLSIALGGLFFTFLHHITNARWSVVLRKISEAIAGNLPMMLIFFIPVIFGIHDLYHWSHPEAVSADELLAKKAPYLNTTFFLFRTGFYFAVWILFSILLRKVSKEQDNQPSEALTMKMKRISAPGIILFAITITFAAFDWLMSLDAHWFSTIFGVYIFSGAFLAFLTFTIIIITYLRINNSLSDTITVEHYHDLGKLAFGFIIFWSYMAFSQYFLIWYANLPEENFWYLYRWDNSWEPVGMIIIFGHFVIPFLGLITRAAKRSIKYLTILSVWILIMHFTDLYWLVLPTHHQEGIHFTLFDLAPLLGIGGLFLWMTLRNLSTSPVVPVNDPKLESSKNFVNS